MVRSGGPGTSRGCAWPRRAWRPRPRGELFLTGNAFLFPLDFGLGEANDGFLVKFSGDGQPLWQRRAGQKKVYGMAADGEGGVLLAGRLMGTLSVDGRAFGTAGGQGLLLLAFEKDGRLAWEKELRGVDGDVTGLRPERDGGAVLVGELRSPFSWGGTKLSEAGAFVLAAGPEGAERWAQPLACGDRPAPPAVAVDDGGQVVAICGGTLSAYSPEGAQRDERTLPPGECPEENCPVAGTTLDFVPGQGLTLAGYQRHGGARAGDAWDQEAFLRLLAP